ncbi:extracellular solute-binding protein [Comamonas sp. NLF-1-9]|uniref:extracellular solute-binding protein n=1 Tax=Comamonas sp. NLF-1-9 TaxID=2853163 RepID=UPI001C48888F|nr:extracellular solute-binding protein [Comamonas sp. NLF-1-9]QXL85641.1 extracellular solute-binding protein [Comamonas sp. NLF-1-9]
MKKLIGALALAAMAAAMALPASAQNATLDVYSGRGQTADEAFYADFVSTSSIEVNRTENTGAATLEALRNEGADSPADVVLLDGIALLAQAEAEGLLQPLRSDALQDAVPAALRAAPDEQGAIAWFGFARNARIVVYQGEQVDAADVDSYQKLASERNRGKLCMAGAHTPANLGLIAALIEHEDSASARRWLSGVKANLARAPEGSDTDQIRAVFAGTCKMALVGQAELARLMQSDVRSDRDAARALAVSFPNQGSWGTHVDVSGAALARHAKHPAQAREFLNYLASSQGQNLFANRNNDWPVVRKFKFDNAELKAMLGSHGGFKADATPLSTIARQLGAARRMAEQIGFDQAPAR